MKLLFVVINENMLCSFDFAPARKIQDVIGRSLTVLDFKSWEASQPKGTSRDFKGSDTIRFATKEDTKAFPTYADAIGTMFNTPDLTPSPDELCDLAARLRYPAPDELCDLAARLRYEFDKATKEARETAAWVSGHTRNFLSLLEQIDSASCEFIRESNNAAEQLATLDLNLIHSKSKDVLRLISASTKEIYLSPIFVKTPSINEDIDSICRDDIPDTDVVWNTISSALKAHMWAQVYHQRALEIYHTHIEASSANESLPYLNERMKKLNRDFRLVQGLLGCFGFNIQALDVTHANWESLIQAIKGVENLVSNTAGIIKECRSDIEKFRAENHAENTMVSQPPMRANPR